MLIIKDCSCLHFIIGKRILFLYFGKDNYEKFGIYKWGHFIYKKLTSYGYHSKYIEFYIGKRMVEIEFVTYRDLDAIQSYYPAIDFSKKGFLNFSYKPKVKQSRKQ